MKAIIHLIGDYVPLFVKFEGGTPDDVMRLVYAEEGCLRAKFGSGIALIPTRNIQWVEIDESPD
jgi:hypothetical protein